MEIPNEYIDTIISALQVTDNLIKKHYLKSDKRYDQCLLKIQQLKKDNLDIKEIRFTNIEEL